MTPIRVLDVCSGYSASTLAWDGLGFEHVGYAEIEAFPSAILGARYGATRPRYMPDPEAEDIDAKERKTRTALRKSMAALNDSHFGNRVVNFGDFTQIREDDVGPVDALTGGTPCQAFSVAGKRLGLDDPRGNLTLEFLALAKRVRAEWLAWENVPGFLSHDDGRTMGTFLGFLGELGYGFAWRVIDAQYVRVDRFARAVPQRRKRLILVGHLGDAAGPAAVLFERESLRGNPAPRREAGQGIAPTISARTKGGGGLGTDFDLDGGAIEQRHPAVSPALKARDFKGPSSDGDGDGAPLIVAPVAATLPAGGNSTGGDRQPGTSAETAGTMLIANKIAASLTRGAESSGKGRYAGRRQEDDFEVDAFVAHSLTASRSSTQCPNAYTLEARAEVQAVAFAQNSRDEVRLFGDDGQTVGALAAEPGMKQQCYVAQAWQVRRLTPTECERLMGTPDGWTAITYRGKPASDGPRYKALGNSQAANWMRWIGHGLADVIRIQRGAE